MDAKDLQIGQRVWVVDLNHDMVEGPITAIDPGASGNLTWVTVSGFDPIHGSMVSRTVLHYHVFASELDAMRNVLERLKAAAESLALVIKEKEAA